MRVGEIISRVNDAVKIRVFINNVSLDLVVNLLILIFTLCLMIVYSWELAGVTLLSAPLFLLIYYNQTIQDALIAADRLFQIMDLEREEDDSHKIRLEPEMVGDICFKNVNFRYGSRRYLFESLNLTIKKGATTAIVGESGSGKTTLASLLQHLYPIQSGKIQIGNYDISQVSNESLRSRISSVSQQIELYAGNITDNIALGDFEPDMKKIAELCEQLGIREFIEQLPYSYMTLIGEQGASLSGGERQRIAIARALYKDPEILIFDEATSSLDSISEKYVKQTLSALAKLGKTIIIIAHRLSTIKNADTIIVLANGKVAESGPHSQLIENKSVYWNLWNEQFEKVD
jgi:ATP-binding cassette subfamily B protein